MEGLVGSYTKSVVVILQKMKHMVMKRNKPYMQQLRSYLQSSYTVTIVVLTFLLSLSPSTNGSTSSRRSSGVSTRSCFQFLQSSIMVFSFTVQG
jgi:hypothetical protein